MSHLYLSIRWKLTIPFILIIVLVVAVLLPVTSRVVARRIEQQADERLILVARSVATQLERGEAQIELSANFVANLPQVVGASYNPDVIRRLLEPRQAELGVHELSYYLPNFHPGDSAFYTASEVVTQPLTVSPAATQTRAELIQRALTTQKPVSGITLDPGAAQIIGAAPIFDASQTRVKGAIVAVFSIDKELLAELGQILGADVGLVQGNTLVASTIAQESGIEEMLRTGFVTPDGRVTARNLSYGDGVWQRLLSYPLMLDGAPQGTVLVAQSINDLFDVRRDIQIVLILFTATVALVSLIFGLAVLFNFAQPLTQLVATTSEVSTGQLHRRVPVAHIVVKDELTLLTENFNIMIARLQGLYDTLEDRVAARTQELVAERNKLNQASEELAQARDQALEASRAKSAFLASMSHELRTPLNAIIGYSEMLQEDAIDQGQQDFVQDLQKIMGAGRHLLGLINDILDLSKVEAGKMDLYLERFNIAAMIHDVVNTIDPLIQKKGNHLEVICPDDIGAMHADMTKVRQTLFNLLSNASKFTERGHIKLTVQREAGLAPIPANGQTPATSQEHYPEHQALERHLERQPGAIRDWIVFTISDTGIGISPEQLTRIFEPFTQADASTMRKYGGTGLGLAISQRFCQMMQGSISVVSEVGQGSTFTVRLPAHVPDLSTATEPAPTPAEALPRSGPGENTVLVIDDDPTVRDLIKRFLSKEDFQVVLATGGEEGLRLARELHPDVITLDVMMPGMDGWSVLTALKADHEIADIPVVMVTIVSDKNMGFALGASEYLTKPIDRERLNTILTRYRHTHKLGPVLVVEDDRPTSEMMQRMLQREGWEVISANNGRVALERVAQQRPALILLDLMMPELDGFGFVAELRKTEDWRAIPIIVVTAKDITTDDRLRLNGYVEQILQKRGSSGEDFLTEVRNLITARASKAATPEPPNP